MNRVAVFVDAGYLFAQGSNLLTGRKLPRSLVLLNAEIVVQALGDLARLISAVPLLRIYWYDGTSTGPSAQHLTMAHQADVKLRLGFVNSFGEQKGVDSLIVTDMIALARNRAISDAVLLSGDEDLRVGVQQAQEFGVRVHLLGIKPSRGSQSLFLLQESDTTHEWTESVVSSFLKCEPNLTIHRSLASEPVLSPVQPTAAIETLGSIPTASAPEATPTQPIQTASELIRLAANARADKLDLSEVAAVIEVFDSTKQVLPDVDRPLLGSTRARLGRELNSQEKKQLRDCFIERCRSRLSA